MCFAGRIICTGGMEGSGCDDGSDCLSGICFKAEIFPLCTSGGPGSRCATAADCAEGMTCMGDSKAVNRCLLKATPPS